MDHLSPVVLAGHLVREVDGWRVLDDLGRVWRLGQVEPAVVRALQQCTGHLSPAALAGDLPDDVLATFWNLIDDLAEAGVLRPVSTGARVAVIGSGRLALATCLALCALGPARLVLTDVGPPDMMLYPRTLASTGAAALQQALRAEVGVEHDLVVGGHWIDLNREQVDVAVVATPTVLPDRAITDHLVRTRIPHLVTNQHRQAAHVGPVVVPGRGACLCCDDIVRSAADPAWPGCVATLSRTASTGDPRMLDWAAQQAALTVAGGLDRAVPGQLWSASVTGGIRSRDWAPHPDCPCRVDVAVNAA
ncbi:hypothetical protein ACSDQ9_02735 [Aestuariimicrobium soli]|uniref:hypothetical protein n=1 Tax=Aestuariimicrobium soli TaxID=2035834 RepID=UPI003EB815EB